MGKGFVLLRGHGARSIDVSHQYSLAEREIWLLVPTKQTQSMNKLVLSIPVTWSDFCINPRKNERQKMARRKQEGKQWKNVRTRAVRRALYGFEFWILQLHSITFITYASQVRSRLATKVVPFHKTKSAAAHLHITDDHFGTLLLYPLVIKRPGVFCKYQASVDWHSSPLQIHITPKREAIDWLFSKCL